MTQANVKRCSKCGQANPIAYSTWGGMGWIVAGLCVFLFPLGLFALLALPFLPPSYTCTSCA